MSRSKFAPILALLAAQAAPADVTIRYQFEFKMGPAIPAAAADAVRQQVGGMLGNGMLVRVKGQRCLSSFGPFTSIVDGRAGQVTLISPASKQFATVPAANYFDQVLGQQQIPADALAALRNLKLDVKAAKTGRTETIRGFQAEDTLINAVLEMPNPTGPGIAIHFDVDEWFASEGQAGWAALQKEISGCSAALGGSTDPGAMIEKLLQQFAGGSGQFSDAIKALADPSRASALRVHAAVSVPALVQLMPPQPGAPPVDPNAPLVEMNLNVTELSADPVADEEFQVPAGYQEVPLQELTKAAQAGLAQASKPPEQAPATSLQTPADYTGTVARPGNGVSNPVPIYKPEPSYTREATAAKISGNVLLSLVIDPEGNTRNIKVVRSLDPGLDQKAIEAVSKWRFKPGMKDGNPVAVQAQIEVSFRLLDRPAGVH
jgi:TonB family protein